MDALDILRLQIEWGADEALLDHPVDRRHPSVGAPAQAASSGPLPRVGPPTRGGPPSGGPQSRGPADRGPASRGPDGWTAEAAGALADNATDLGTLAQALRRFDPDGLSATATAMVLGQGEARLGLAVIGDAPGDHEDRSGMPFGGPAGALLDRMLASIGLGRADLLLVHLLPWRPPGGRPISEREVAAYAPFLHRRMVLGGASRLLLLGTAATRAFLGREASLARVRGRWHDASVTGIADPVPALSSHGPAQLLDRPELKAQSWADLRLLRRTLDTGGRAP